VTRVLVVDDEPPLLRALVLNLSHLGYEVTTASTASGALQQVRRLPPDLLILDLGLPDLDGLEVIRELRDREPTLPIIVLSARRTSQDKVAALDLGAVDYVAHPGCPAAGPRAPGQRAGAPDRGARRPGPHRKQLPADLPRATAPQARTDPQPTAAPHHRTRPGIPVPPLTASATNGIRRLQPCPRSSSLEPVSSVTGPEQVAGMGRIRF